MAVATAEKILQPASETELAEAVTAARADKTPLEIRGGGTRAGLGHPVQAERVLSTSGLSGISLYEPGALTMVVKAGTPMVEVEKALEAEGQRLPFEPMDHRALLGSEGEPTIGGVVVCAVSGPRRIQAGACRDSMLGVRLVTGKGEIVSNGGRVMKNVTGYDLVKLMAGSYGTLGVLTEVSLKVLPRPAVSNSLVIEGLDDTAAVSALSAAITTPYEVNGAAHLTGRDRAAARTVLRVEGMEAQAGYRATELAKALSGFGEVAQVTGGESDSLWREIRDVAAFAGREGAVWRLSLKPSDSPQVVAALREELEIEAHYDWAGGLIWLLTSEAGNAGADAVRAQTAARGGHATLIRASAGTRAAVQVFEPEPEPLARISQGLRAKFDPDGILNPGRMRA